MLTSARSGGGRRSLPRNRRAPPRPPAPLPEAGWHKTTHPAPATARCLHIPAAAIHIFPCIAARLALRHKHAENWRLETGNLMENTNMQNQNCTQTSSVGRSGAHPAGRGPRPVPPPGTDARRHRHQGAAPPSAAGTQPMSPSGSVAVCLSQCHVTLVPLHNAASTTSGQLKVKIRSCEYVSADVPPCYCHAAHHGAPCGGPGDGGAAHAGDPGADQ